MGATSWKLEVMRVVAYEGEGTSGQILARVRDYSSERKYLTITPKLLELIKDGYLRSYVRDGREYYAATELGREFAEPPEILVPETRWKAGAKIGPWVLLEPRRNPLGHLVWWACRCTRCEKETVYAQMTLGKKPPPECNCSTTGRRRPERRAQELVKR